MKIKQTETNPVPYTQGGMLGYEHVCSADPWVKNFDPREDGYGYSIDVAAERTRDSRVLVAEALDLGDNTPGNVRLLTSAWNAYAHHCGQWAVNCAEADLLGDLLFLARQVLDSKGTPDHLKAWAYKAIRMAENGGGSPGSKTAAVAS